MGWVRRFLSPSRRAWTFALERLRLSTPKNRQGFSKLYNDVKSCPYEDVHVMWSMLQKMYPPPATSKQI